MTFASVAASSLLDVVVRLASDGSISHRWLDHDAAEWSPWTAMPFQRRARGVAALSGYADQIEIFVLAEDGSVWNRWWRSHDGWTPRTEFSPLGSPFGADGVELTAHSAGNGYFECFVATADGRVGVLPHLPGPERATWRRCSSAARLGDGWWPAFASETQVNLRCHAR